PPESCVEGLASTRNEEQKEKAGLMSGLYVATMPGGNRSARALRSSARLRVRRGSLHGIGRQILRAEGQVIADDPHNLVVVKIAGPDFPLGVLLVFLEFLGPLS